MPFHYISHIYVCMFHQFIYLPKDKKKEKSDGKKKGGNITEINF